MEPAQIRNAARVSRTDVTPVGYRLPQFAVHTPAADFRQVIAAHVVGAA